MTSDDDTALGELLFETAVQLWPGDSGGTAGTGATAGLPTVADHQIAEATDTDLDVVRAWLDVFDGDRLVVGRDGETRTVKGLVDPAV